MGVGGEKGREGREDTYEIITNERQPNKAEKVMGRVPRRDKRKKLRKKRTQKASSGI